ncbi:Processive diacylglycerol beta-glucosyltransferase [Pelotomaculum schinkii]|uniref:Processive diacylglycerol beta-glucosyltransferase n=1 Tax=Pelotomaculum schinkii TaxID=78350 RepID=A0A4Y7R641_9FIRM|nr:MULTISPECIES: glycosyltransferase [Pelotomaculum]TEB04415.1 Processive diacylglycerol beta-glucosyltransferase [Pelotomaculum schinkii]TEB15263.1 Processive diacylglycerol beta-glucosyltransferase [Pelotomaculum sp. FP]
MKTKRERKILILYASYGDGHVQVSKALQQRFLERGLHNVLMLDLYANAHPLMDAVTRFAYLMSCSFCPKLYGWSYYLTQNMQHKWTPVNFLNTFGIGALREIIRVERPDAVINTFPMAVMAELRKQTGLQIPIFTVLTDFVLHDRWIHQEIDHYFVANEELKTAIINKGIPAERVKVSGIPLRKAFCQTYNKNQLFLRYGLEPSKKIVLIMAGAYGVMRNLKKICRALLDLEDIQILLVCGKNQALKERIEASFAQKPNIYIFGFVEHIQELMSISSCMITKAGGITLSEALSLQLPVIVFRPLPGQEKENAYFLANKGAAKIACKIEELVQHLEQILYERQQVSQMKKAIYALQRKDASEAIVLDILNELDGAGV